MDQLFTTKILNFLTLRLYPDVSFPELRLSRQGSYPESLSRLNHGPDQVGRSP